MEAKYTEALKGVDVGVEWKELVCVRRRGLIEEGGETRSESSHHVDQALLDAVQSGPQSAADEAQA